jgi:riboflavin kinase/FMN adenylyltransferase
VLEAYLLDFAGDLYGQEVEAEFIAFLRPDATFATPQALAAQMREDCDSARAVLAKIDADDPIRRFPLARALAKGAPST